MTLTYWANCKRNGTQFYQVSACDLVVERYLSLPWNIDCGKRRRNIYSYFTVKYLTEGEARFWAFNGGQGRSLLITDMFGACTSRVKLQINFRVGNFQIIMKVTLKKQNLTKVQLPFSACPTTPTSSMVTLVIWLNRTWTGLWTSCSFNVHNIIML